MVFLLSPSVVKIFLLPFPGIQDLKFPKTPLTPPSRKSVGRTIAFQSNKEDGHTTHHTPHATR
ncbi:hypothetical protein E2C01_085158 [Portunus trituberculatus]|uniref:Uncharacterized protein n=1 Tax=Portunus trituberculatus TaxID=210409 RepID=A0A5B7J5Y1_PORTR|nr:hypothetical protein [Portunus trituberculatus]